MSAELRDRRNAELLVSLVERSGGELRNAPDGKIVLAHASLVPRSFRALLRMYKPTVRAMLLPAGEGRS